MGSNKEYQKDERQEDGEVVQRGLLRKFRTPSSTLVKIKDGEVKGQYQPSMDVQFEDVDYKLKLEGDTKGGVKAAADVLIKQKIIDAASYARSRGKWGRSYTEKVTNDLSYELNAEITQFLSKNTLDDLKTTKLDELKAEISSELEYSLRRMGLKAEKIVVKWNDGKPIIDQEYLKKVADYVDGQLSDKLKVYLDGTLGERVDKKLDKVIADVNNNVATVTATNEKVANTAGIIEDKLNEIRGYVSGTVDSRVSEVRGELESVGKLLTELDGAVKEHGKNLSEDVYTAPKQIAEMKKQIEELRAELAKPELRAKAQVEKIADNFGDVKTIIDGLTDLNIIGYRDECLSRGIEEIAAEDAEKVVLYNDKFKADGMSSYWTKAWKEIFKEGLVGRAKDIAESKPPKPRMDYVSQDRIKEIIKDTFKGALYEKPEEKAEKKAEVLVQ